MTFDVAVQRSNGIVCLRLTGEMDMAAVGPFRDTVTTLEQEPGLDLIVDLSGLSFIDSSGLHELVELHSRSKDAARVVEVVGPSDRLSRLLKLTRIEYVITLDEDSRLLSALKRPDPGS